MTPLLFKVIVVCAQYLHHQDCTSPDDPKNDPSRTYILLLELSDTEAAVRPEQSQVEGCRRWMRLW